MHQYAQIQNFHAFKNAFSQIISCINIGKLKISHIHALSKIFILKKSMHSYMHFHIFMQKKLKVSCIFHKKETMVVILSTWSRSQLFKRWFVTLSA